MMGLTSPEGIAFDALGNLYAVEDVKGGRVVRLDTNGLTSTVVAGLDSPEGIVWVNSGSVSGTLYATESDLEYALSMSSTNPNDYRTNITRVSLDGTATRILTTTAILTQTLFPPRIALQFWSYSGLAAGPDGRLYVGNELAGQHIYTTAVISTIPFSVHLFSGASVYWAFTTTVPATRTAFTDDTMFIPEGLRFGADGNWPLYVAEEDSGSGLGRVSVVQANGAPAPFCTGFETIEDVIWDAAGNLFVSEDTTGLVIHIAPLPPPPPPLWLYLPLIVR
jgi:sugar lactone lactonase YvrE